jgi:putative ABC transport system ATP-binding protein
MSNNNGNSANGNSAVVELENVTKVYQMGDVKVHALCGISLTVHKGEYLAIMGASGSGKSTLMNIIGLLDRPTAGNYCINGTDVTKLGKGNFADMRNREIGFVFQRFNLLPTLTAQQNIAIAQHIQGNGYNPHRFYAVVDMLGIREKLHHKPFALSGGEQQRVAIARAVICEPKILLADEPTGNLDTENSQIVLNMLRALNRSFRQTILMITHNPEAAAVADRVVRMRDGRIVAD